MTMKALSFSLSSDLSRSQQDAILAKIKSWQGVQSAARLDADAQDAVIADMCFAEVTDDAAQTIAAQLATMTGVEHVERPTPRYLV